MAALKYKGFLGNFGFQSDACYFYGNLLLERDNVSFKAATMEELEQNFKNSVDNYLADCAAFGIEPG